MKAFFDTSVLVAVFWQEHPHHKISLDLFYEARKKEAVCAAHSLAEVYAVMTRLPAKAVLAPEQVILFVQEIRERLTVISLGEDEYYSTLQHAAERSAVGGRIYDALLLKCALKAKAEIIYTWNLKHFRQLAPEAAERIRTP